MRDQTPWAAAAVTPSCWASLVRAHPKGAVACLHCPNSHFAVLDDCSFDYEYQTRAETLLSVDELLESLVKVSRVSSARRVVVSRKRGSRGSSVQQF